MIPAFRLAALIASAKKLSTEYSARALTSLAENSFMLPQTSAATAALSVANRYYSPGRSNHCLRSYLWGTMYGAAHNIVYDDEL